MCTFCDYGILGNKAGADHEAEIDGRAEVDVRVVESSTYPTLNSGYWVVLSGHFSSETDAKEYQKELRSKTPKVDSLLRWVSKVPDSGPIGSSFWTDILKFSRTRSEIDAFAAQAHSKRFPAAVIQMSSKSRNYAGLWVVYSGHFQTPADATYHAHVLRNARVSVDKKCQLQPQMPTSTSGQGMLSVSCSAVK